MPASKAEQVLDALKTLLKTVPDAASERNSVLPEKIPAGGLIILRDGDPGEPEQALGGFGNAYYRHVAEIESTSRKATRRRAMLPSMPCSRRSERRSKPTRALAVSPSA